MSKEIIDKLDRILMNQRIIFTGLNISEANSNAIQISIDETTKLFEKYDDALSEQTAVKKE